VLIVFGATGAVGHALLQCVMKDTHLGKDVKVGRRDHTRSGVRV
jgi:uncharacterized protein YbjT (DUF2867 family)